MSTIQSIDQALFHIVNVLLTNTFFDHFFPAITDLHKTWQFKFIFLPLVLASLVYFQKLRGFLIFIGLGVSIGLADKIGNIGKHFWQRPRPFQTTMEVIQRSGAGGFSFPSNHAVNMFCMAFFFSTFFPKYRWFFFSAATLVAFSRVYNGVHYPFDVIAGAALGTFIGIFGAELTLRAVRKVEDFTNRRKKKQHHV